MLPEKIGFQKNRRILKRRPLRVESRVNKPTNAKKKKSKKKGGM